MKMNYRSAATFAAAMLALTAAGKANAATETGLTGQQQITGFLSEDGSYDGVYDFIVNWIYNNKDVDDIAHDSRLGADLEMDSLNMFQITVDLGIEYGVNLLNESYYVQFLSSYFNVTVENYAWIVYSFVATEK